MHLNFSVRKAHIKIVAGTVDTRRGGFETYPEIMFYHKHYDVKDEAVNDIAVIKVIIKNNFWILVTFVQVTRQKRLDLKSSRILRIC